MAFGMGKRPYRAMQRRDRPADGRGDSQSSEGSGLPPIPGPRPDRRPEEPEGEKRTPGKGPRGPQSPRDARGRPASPRPSPVKTSRSRGTDEGLAASAGPTSPDEPGDDIVPRAPPSPRERDGRGPESPRIRANFGRSRTGPLRAAESSPSAGQGDGPKAPPGNLTGMSKFIGRPAAEKAEKSPGRPADRPEKAPGRPAADKTPGRPSADKPEKGVLSPTERRVNPLERRTNRGSAAGDPPDRGRALLLQPTDGEPTERETIWGTSSPRDELERYEPAPRDAESVKTVASDIKSLASHTGLRDEAAATRRQETAQRLIGVKRGASTRESSPDAGSERSARLGNVASSAAAAFLNRQRERDNSVCSDRDSDAGTTTPKSNSSGTNEGSGTGGSRSHGTGSSTASKRSSKSLYISFEDFSIDLEHEKDRGADTSGIRVLKTFQQLFEKSGPNGEGVLHCLELYGFNAPNKLQMHAIPAIVHAVGPERESSTSRPGKSCVVIQGPPGIGKTSSLVLALLAAVDTSIPQCQAVVVTAKQARDFDKFFNVFTLMHAATCVTFSAENRGDAASDDGREALQGSLGPEGWTPPWLGGTEETDEEQMLQARKAMVLAGDPSKILHLVSKPEVNMEHVRSLVIDDVGLVIEDAQNLKRGEGHPSLLDEVIKICQTLQLRSERRLRYVILSEFLKEDASKKTLRLLKNSLMKKKNLLSHGLTTTTMKAHKQVKHYTVQAPRRDWVRILKLLVSSLMFPRAIIYTDDYKPERIEFFLREMRLLDLEVSVNISSLRRYENAHTTPSHPESRPDEDAVASGDVESRRLAVQEFSSGRSQFLFTTSEPAVCQLVLPKVKAVFHLDVPADMLSVYGVRLLPLEQPERQVGLADPGVSILFVESTSKVTEISKLFGINFMVMPFDLIPESSSK